MTSPTSIPPGGAFDAAVNYEVFTFVFTADDTSATVLFTDLPSNETGSVDGKLDAVSIDAVPEPSSLLLLATGTLPFALRLKRRSSSK